MGDSADKEITLTEEHVIIIACVCGVIIVTLLIILFCFIFRRRRNAEKVYQGGNQGDPPPYNAVPPNKKQAYDNQGMDTSDLQFTPSAPYFATVNRVLPPALPHDLSLHANLNGFTNNSYGPLDLPMGYNNYQQPAVTPSPSLELNMAPWAINLDSGSQRVAVATGSQPGYPGSAGNRPATQEEHNLQHQYNGGVDGFVNRDGLNASVTHSPAKDKYIGLQERGGGGGDHMAGEGGDSILPTNPKPKKVVYEVVV